MDALEGGVENARVSDFEREEGIGDVVRMASVLERCRHARLDGVHHNDYG